VLDRLIDHAALFPPASMPLDVALEEDRAARQSEAAALMGRFVVPARLLRELPDDRPALSVVLSGPEDAALLPGIEGVEAVESVLDAPRPRPQDLLAAYRELEPLGVEAYFELVFDAGWRDAVPAAIGAIAALGARVKLRCGGAYTPSVEQVALVIAMRRGEEHGFLNILAATTAPNARLADVLAEEDAAGLDLEAPDRSLFRSFGSCSWREPVDDLEALGLLA